MIIIHGENTIASREKLVDCITQSKLKGNEIVRIESKSLTEAQLEELLGTSDLFGTEKTVIIDSLHSLPTSKKKKNLVAQLKNSQLHELILWEKRALTKTMLKPFPSAQVFEYKASKTLFAWLDLFGKSKDSTKKLTLLHDAFNSDGEYFCFLMLIRQFRLLIQVKTGAKVGGAPFMITKLKSQANNFTEEELLKIYKKLLKIDIAQKTSKNLLSLQQELDLLTTKL
jgi:DNA polymerase III delta subunit